MTKYKFSITTALAILILLLMSIPNDIKSDSMFGIPHTDKIVHVAMFFALTSIFFLETFFKKKSWKHFLRNILLLFCFALSTEILQKLSGYRTFDVLDLLADSLGIILGYICTKIFIKIKKFKFE